MKLNMWNYFIIKKKIKHLIYLLIQVNKSTLTCMYNVLIKHIKIIYIYIYVKCINVKDY